MREIVCGALLPAALAMSAQGQGAVGWPQHSMDRPQPRIVTPAPAGPPVAPPSDAIVLFDGRSLADWRAADTTRGPARWKVADGYMEVVAGTGDIATRRGFGDAQLHIEFATPSPASPRTGQDRGNSGVYLMSRYEVQVLDSYENATYPDGQAAALYGQEPPLVNASRKPGEWQTYDILFRRPRFDGADGVVSPARITVWHNGVLVHDDVALLGPTSHRRRAPYVAHPDAMPLLLQDHGDPVRYRNIWVRELRNGDAQGARRP